MDLGEKIIKDAIYGYIEVPKKFLDFIDNNYFQRLRYIKQLGFTYLVYPNANHTRFCHSLGVFHLTNLFISVNNIKEFKNELLLAALYHDIGHGPFSHSFEYATNFEFNHEKEGLSILNELQDKIEKIMDFKVVKDFFLGKGLGSIITSDLGTDRLDYLKRDSYFTGVEFGKIDGERIIRNTKFVDNGLIISEKAIYEVYNTIISRFLMYKAVYLHKLSLLFDEIFKEAVQLFLEDENLENIKRLTDNELLFLMKQSKNKRIKELVERIFYRRKPKYNYSIELTNPLKKEELENLQQELRKIEVNTWVFQINKIYKMPKIKIDNKRISQFPIIKSLKKEDTTKLYIYSDKELKNNIKNYLKT